MSRAGRAALLFGVALCGFGGAPAFAAAMGSLAPHNPDGQLKGRWLADPSTNCWAVDSDYDPGDTIMWQGRCQARMTSGPGTLTFFNNGRTIETISGTFDRGLLQPGHVTAVWADRSRYDGDQSGGQFDGQGIFTSATGDTAEGQWKAGALNGRGRVVWANGDRYDGDWIDGESDGEGTEIWANGDRYQGLWRDGKPVGQIGQTASGAAAGRDAAEAAQSVADRASGAPSSNGSDTARLAAALAAPAVLPAQQAPDASAMHDHADATGPGAPLLPLQPFMGRTLVAVDGSTASFKSTDGGFVRLISLPNATTQQTSFTFLNDRIGTVSKDAAAIGLFRTSAQEVDVDYTDGSIESIKPAGDGVLATLHGPDGALSCTAWYPSGHVFSEEQKREAVQEYASRLGVPSPAPSKTHRGTRSAPVCGGGWLASAAASANSIDASANAKIPSQVTSRTAARQPASKRQPAAATAAASSLQQVPVKESVVHLIDAPYEPGASQARVEQTKFTGDETPAALSSSRQGSEPAAAPQTNASACLSVASNGAYWGFQNRCSEAVQFSYCEMSDANPLTSCHHTTVAGSVAANGFSALVGDRSLSEQGVKHEFRWMACDGGAGEVVPHLDSIDPPAGRCQRVVPAD